MSKSRQLAAIMFTDIVGYTALMGNDEQRAFDLLNKNRQLQRPIIEEFNGRWIKEMGDGVMASFHTVSDAVKAAVKIQEACNSTKDFQLRIGIHQGEVLFERDDIFGDVVNLAARIQSAASPGCIFISETVHHNISNKSEIRSQFVLEERLKNVSQPVRMYQVLFAGSKVIAAKKLNLPVAENSIAVLPFLNRSSDPEQEFFSDGMTETIINMLAQVPRMKVIGRTSSFAFKGKNMDLKLIGEQLNVAYLLEGSVRRSANKLRVKAQLINVADGFHLYSGTFDRELEDIFAIEDEIALAILDAIKFELFNFAKKNLLKRYTENIEAYELYLNGRFHVNKCTPDGFLKAIEYFEAAIKIDPAFAIAHSGLVFCYMNFWTFGWMPVNECLPKAIEAARHGLQLDSEIAESHLAIGRIALHHEMDIPRALEHFNITIRINPNSDECLVQLGFCEALLGRGDQAIVFAEQAYELNPFSLMNLYYIGLVSAISMNLEKLIEYGKKLIELEPNFFGGHALVGYGLMYLKQEDCFAELELANRLNNDLRSLADLANAHNHLGNKSKATEILGQMKSAPAEEKVINPVFANVYLALGELDLAFDFIEKSIENKEGLILFYLHVHRHTAGVSDDPRFRKYLERLGLPY
jgi:TolB-like protein/class 3 adenylate cyclase